MKKLTYISGILVLLASSICSGQSSSEANVVRANANACEQNSAEVDLIRSIAKEKPSQIFVISHAGTGESENINAKRLAHVRKFLTVRKRWDLLNVVYSLGDKVTGLGQIEFYVGAKLALIIQSSFGRTPCMDCCGPDFLSNPRNLIKKRSRSPRR